MLLKILLITGTKSNMKINKSLEKVDPKWFWLVKISMDKLMANMVEMA